VRGGFLSPTPTPTPLLITSSQGQAARTCLRCATLQGRAAFRDTSGRLCPASQHPHSFACIAPASHQRLSWLTMANARVTGAPLALIALSSDLAHLTQHALSWQRDALLRRLGLLCRCAHLPGARAPRCACAAQLLLPPVRNRRTAAGGEHFRLKGCHAGPRPCDTAAVSEARAGHRMRTRMHVGPGAVRRL